MIFDTDVLIWCLRGNPRAASVLRGSHRRGLSVVSYMELLQGARDRKEMGLIRSFLGDLDFQTWPLSEAIGHRASIYLEEYTLKAGLTMADALIAATAVEADVPLCTGNIKHFRAIAELRLSAFRPT